MGKPRTIFHVLFANLLKQPGTNSEGAVLRHLWPRIGTEALAEFKSCGRGFEKGDLIKLLGYAAQHHTDKIERIDDCANLKMVVIVPSITPTFREDCYRLALRREELERGYYRLKGAVPYETLAIDLGRVAEAEADLLLKWFAERKIQDDETQRWISAKHVWRRQHRNDST